MDAKLKHEWLVALRSKKYRQGEGALRITRGSRHSYCCLGVLCAAMGANWQKGRPQLGTVELEHEEECYLSSAAIEITGLDRSTQELLATMNDSGVPFAEIADHIECSVPAEVPESPQVSPEARQDD